MLQMKYLYDMWQKSDHNCYCQIVHISAEINVHFHLAEILSIICPFDCQSIESM